MDAKLLKVNSFRNELNSMFKDMNILLTKAEKLYLNNKNKDNTYLLDKLILLSNNIKFHKSEMIECDNKYMEIAFTSLNEHDDTSKYILEINNIKDCLTNKDFLDISLLISEFPELCFELKVNLLYNKNLTRTQLNNLFTLIYIRLIEKNEHETDYTEINNKINIHLDKYVSQKDEDVNEILLKCEKEDLNENDLKSYHEKLFIYLYPKFNNFLSFKVFLNKELEERIILELLNSSYKDVIIFFYIEKVSEYIFSKVQYTKNDFEIILSPFFINNKKDSKEMFYKRFEFPLKLLLEYLILSSELENYGEKNIFLHNVENNEDISIYKKYMEEYENFIFFLNLTNQNYKNLLIFNIFHKGNLEHIQILKNNFPNENFDLFQDIFDFRFSKEKN